MENSNISYDYLVVNSSRNSKLQQGSQNDQTGSFDVAIAEGSGYQAVSPTSATVTVQAVADTVAF